MWWYFEFIIMIALDSIALDFLNIGTSCVASNYRVVCDLIVKPLFVQSGVA